MKKEIKKSMELGGRTLTLSTGKLAMQATSSVLAQYGETVVLATVVAKDLKEDIGYFPLSVEYQERLYAGGKIKGSRWVKREGKPTDDEILIGRLIDRSIRPLFPKEFKKEVQVIITVLSVDLKTTAAYLAPIAVSAAIEASNIPWEGPVSVVSVGLNEENNFIVNPTEEEIKTSSLDLVVSATQNAIIMIEAGAKEVSEENILKGIEFAQKEGENIREFITSFAKEVGAEKLQLEKHEISKELVKKVDAIVSPKIAEVVKSLVTGEGGRSEAYNNLEVEVVSQVSEEEAEDAKYLVEKAKKEHIRKMILSGERPDGRALDQIRPLWSEVSVLPRTHGSSIFTRGETQVLNVVTLGSSAMGQLIETAEGEEEKNYIHHYSMPPYSTGEVGRVGNPSRREIGHGALAERALEPVIPDSKAFPYTIRVVSEVTSSNGSTSMASTCASTLSLMDAGVPIKSPVSGIAMGLIIEDDKNYAVLSDIAGIEDFNGDMDFKVTGTENGVTALQLDVKTLNLTHKILSDAMAKASIGRKFILEHMISTIKEPRADLSIYAPKIMATQIDPTKIGEVVGSGGKTIKKIMADMDVQIDIEDDGRVSVSGISEEMVKKAIEHIENIVREVAIGEIYEGEVKRIETYGVFVEYLPGRNGLVKIGDMASEFVNDPRDLVSEGQKVQVRIKEVDNMGRINLSMNMDPSLDKPSAPRESRPYRENRSFDRGNQRNGGNRRNFGGPRRDNRNHNQDRRSSGPHFPASRFMDDQKKGQF